MTTHEERLHMHRNSLRIALACFALLAITYLAVGISSALANKDELTVAEGQEGERLTYKAQLYASQLEAHDLKRPVLLEAAQKAEAERAAFAAKVAKAHGVNFAAGENIYWADRKITRVAKPADLKVASPAVIEKIKKGKKAESKPMDGGTP